MRARPGCDPPCHEGRSKQLEISEEAQTGGVCSPRAAQINIKWSEFQPHDLSQKFIAKLIFKRKLESHSA